MICLEAYREVTYHTSSLAQVVDVARLVVDAEIAGKEQAELTRLKTDIILLK